MLPPLVLRAATVFIYILIWSRTIMISAHKKIFSNINLSETATPFNYFKNAKGIAKVPSLDPTDGLQA